MTHLAKRALDVVLSGTGLIVSMPLWALVAAAIKLDDGGDVFYSQPRVGEGGRIFQVFKFRSMVPDAEAASGARQATAGDSADHARRAAGCAPPRWTSCRSSGVSFVAT